MLDHDILHDIMKQSEQEYIEYKENNGDPERIAKYVSALSNSAAIYNQKFGFMIFGVADSDLSIVGTSFQPHSQKKGNENFIAWLERSIQPNINIEFHELELESQRIVVIQIPAAQNIPTAFNNNRYIRSGSSLKNLKDYPNKETKLWTKLNKLSFEEQIAMEDVSIDDINSLLSIETYFKEMGVPIPASLDLTVDFLLADGLVTKNTDGSYNITKLGAISFAHRLSDFKNMKKHGLRVIKYLGVNKLQTESDFSGTKGYAVGFNGILKYVNSKVSKYEVYEGAKRIEKSDYPELTLREIIANALIHQDFSITGTSPMIEIYIDRIVITNPGQPLIPLDRLMDAPPRSRNEKLADLFRKMGFIEERGSGIDKAVIELEDASLPAPRMRDGVSFFELTLFTKKEFSQLREADKLQSIYLHASRKWLEEDFLTNASVRNRFGLSKNDSSKASKVIAKAVEQNLIIPYDKEASSKNMKYWPYWAK
ncbi:ATP-binding protein [Leuconostoc citreum]|uniref:ATP-binding protein n=1 Tax=Leuconostoc citreum TaxID=33964 RepID=UPI000C2866AA|nr:RNA-binding domain-containing protein [Leuconostoc citreum]